MTPANPANHSAPVPPPRLGVVACAVMEMELEHYGRGMEHIVSRRLLEQGLHNEPPRLRREVQRAVDEMEDDPRVQAIVLLYGLCSRGVEGVTTRSAPLVVPRAHDCITILLGSKERYAEYVGRHPGTYWYSPGWNKHHTPPGPERYRRLYEQYAAKYGQDNAEYLMQEEQAWFHKYNRATYVDLTVGATERDLQYTQACAAWLKWDFDRQRGDPALLVDLLAGRWDDQRFLVLEPGQTVTPSADERVVAAIPAGAARPPVDAPA